MTQAEHQALRDGFAVLRRGSSVLRDGACRFEGKPWMTENDRLVRRADGWELRVYRIEGDTEACLISPDGKSKTYS